MFHNIYYGQFFIFIGDRMDNSRKSTIGTEEILKHSFSSVFLFNNSRFL